MMIIIKIASSVQCLRAIDVNLSWCMARSSKRYGEGSSAKLKALDKEILITNLQYSYKI